MGVTMDWIRMQIKSDLAGITADQVKSMVIAMNQSGQSVQVRQLQQIRHGKFVKRSVTASVKCMMLLQQTLFVSSMVDL